MLELKGMGAAERRAKVKAIFERIGAYLDARFTKTTAVAPRVRPHTFFTR